MGKVAWRLPDSLLAQALHPPLGVRQPFSLFALVPGSHLSCICCWIMPNMSATKDNQASSRWSQQIHLLVCIFIGLLLNFSCAQTSHREVVKCGFWLSHSGVAWDSAILTSSQVVCSCWSWTILGEWGVGFLSNTFLKSNPIRRAALFQHLSPYSDLAYTHIVFILQKDILREDVNISLLLSYNCGPHSSHSAPLMSLCAQ